MSGRTAVGRPEADPEGTGVACSRALRPLVRPLASRGPHPPRIFLPIAHDSQDVYFELACHRGERGLRTP
jgi:hypothetical protein